eukprot:scaffold84_cov163-Amphora_coffeaeformis.AAC.6
MIFSRIQRAARRSKLLPSARYASSSLLPDAVVKVRGDVPYGSREYLLLPPRTKMEDVAVDANLVLASLRANRNILFGAKIVNAELKSKYSLVDLCPALVEAAVHDAGLNGEQPQALATLHGLCAYIEEEIQKTNDKDTNPLWKDISDMEMEAVRAIATGVPRPGHSVVGVGTFHGAYYSDGEAAWGRLAKHFVEKAGGSEESQLYVAQGGQLVLIDHLAATQPDYLAAAGGAMARFSIASNLSGRTLCHMHSWFRVVVTSGNLFRDLLLLFLSPDMTIRFTSILHSLFVSLIITTSRSCCWIYSFNLIRRINFILTSSIHPNLRIFLASSVYERQAVVALAGKRVAPVFESVAISEAVRRAADLLPEAGSRSAMLFAFHDRSILVRGMVPYRILPRYPA